MQTMFQLLREIQQGKREFVAASEDDVEFQQIVSLLKEAEKQGLIEDVAVLPDTSSGIYKPIAASVSKGLTRRGEQFVEEHSERPAAVR